MVTKDREVPQISVILPTYKEEKNLHELVSLIFRAIDSIGLKGECIVVDDDSDDATESTCMELGRDHDLKLIVRKGERGLSTAVVRGLREARGEIFIVMDADLSHPPEKIPEMIDQVMRGADFVLGSRYVYGGKIEEKWGIYRRLNSKVATGLAYFLTKIKDPMSGFFCIPRKTFHACKELSPIGYKIALEILVKSGARNILEVPILFSRRKHGESKMNLKEQLLYIQHLGRLYKFRYPNRMQLIFFLTVGFSGFLLDTFLYFQFQYLFGLQHLVARGLSFFAAASWNWYWNRILTFGQKRLPRYVSQWLYFVAMSCVSFTFNWGCYYILSMKTVYFSDHKYQAFIAGVIAGTASNFIFSKYLVFRLGNER